MCSRLEIGGQNIINRILGPINYVLKSFSSQTPFKYMSVPNLNCYSLHRVCFPLMLKINILHPKLIGCLREFYTASFLQ